MHYTNRRATRLTLQFPSLGTPQKETTTIDLPRVGSLSFVIFRNYIIAKDILLHCYTKKFNKSLN